jgi:hypothetical protein
MKAKILFYALPVLILASIHLAEAQQQSKIYKIGEITAHPGYAARLRYSYEHCVSSATSKGRT